MRASVTLFLNMITLKPYHQVATVSQIWQPAAKFDRIRAQFCQNWQRLPNLVPVRRLVTSSNDKLYVGLGSTGTGFDYSV